GFGDGAHHQPRLEDAEAGSAILLGDADAEPTVLRERGDEFQRKPSLAITLQPVFVAETAAEAGNRGDQALLLLAQTEIHRCTRGAVFSTWKHEGAATKNPRPEPPQ